ncbi:5-keto-4-deoxyuronate isomerase [Clostridium novyi B str. ATCC 27606]|uniref:4-deoxy-L-threo-5-hexosulose-uronate ketol-isomerase n=1 Tax=Clostridium novyi B str. ATCC 27606 TaxID=1443123 RepID=A0AA40ISY0_CLONO|nr:5-dehydro-4-deoxy-D-glucuronate isomerase [Clostridium novyi]KEI13260.1 5-keto-4-deoxyuronate isomerase [Clostridium novyi B str. ATCC 27606]
MDIRYANHPEDSKKYTTEELRKYYHVENIFKKDEISLTYSHVDRIVFGGAMPTDGELSLTAGKEMGVDFFLQRREMGVINVGGEGSIILDGSEYEMKKRDGLYIGMGIKEVKFKSKDKSNPAKFYINSVPAHRSYPIAKIDIKNANPVQCGEQENVNKRTIYQYVHSSVCESCQLLMGMTVLEPGNVWNTMPCHTHERRMEVYFYFDMDEDTRVFHLMGEPQETRHIVMKNEEAIISPSWSIHSGVGTASYTFIWGMCGENQTFDDMDHVKMQDLK